MLDRKYGKLFRTGIVFEGEKFAWLVENIRVDIYVYIKRKIEDGNGFRKGMSARNVSSGWTKIVGVIIYSGASVRIVRY